MTEVFLGIDIGGSHVGVGCISAEDGTLLCLQSSSVDKHDTFDGLIELVCDTVAKLFEREAAENCSVLHVLSIGIGCPGQCKDGILIGACIFSFSNVPLADVVSTRLSAQLNVDGKIPAVLLNDADAAIAAEVWGYEGRIRYGPAKNIAMITIGTGLGLGLVLDGKLYQGSRGLVEGGHIIIDNKNQGRKCSCGQVGCVEAYSSGKNTSIRMFEMDVAEERERAKKRASFSVYPDKVVDTVADDLIVQYESAEIEMGDATDVFTRAEQGDHSAQTILNETAEALATLCINICRILDPEFIIIGGGMSLAGDPLLSLIQTHFKIRAWNILDDDVRIVLSSNSDEAGIVGAALHASLCYIRAQDDVAVDRVTIDLNGQVAQAMKASRSVEVLNYMFNNSNSISIGKLDEIGSSSRTSHNYNHNYLSSPPFRTPGRVNFGDRNNKYTGIKQKIEYGFNENDENENAGSGVSGCRFLSNFEVNILSFNSAFSLLSMGTIACVLFNRNATSIASKSAELNSGSKTTNFLLFSALTSQVCVSTYLLFRLRNRAP